MFRVLLFSTFLTLQSSFAQNIDPTTPPSEIQNIMFIFQMDGDQIGEKDIVLNTDELQLHPLSSGDSLLVSFTGDSLLYSIDPEHIYSIIVIKNKDEIEHYTKKEVENLVILKFKDEKQFLSMINKD